MILYPRELQGDEKARDEEEETSAYDQLLWSIVGKKQRTGKRRLQEEERVPGAGEHATDADDSGDEVESVVSNGSDEVASESGGEESGGINGLCSLGYVDDL